MQLLTNPRLMLMSAFVPVAAFGVAMGQALNPALPDWATALLIQPEEAVIIPPFYLELGQPLQLGLKGGRVQLMVNLAFSARLGQLDLLDLSTRVKSLEDVVLAELSNDLLAASLRDQDLQRLRRELPVTFRDTVNRVLGTEALPAPVDEVLIMEVARTDG